MRIDMHTHCQPASRCAGYLPEEIPAMLKEKGIDAIVLTNHYYDFHCNDLSPDLHEQAEIFIDIYRRCKESGAKIGLKVFFGVEIKLIREPFQPEFLLYGFSEEDFRESFPLYNLSRKELFHYCCEKDVLMVQAHPYSNQKEFSNYDLRYIHGIEVYNPHPLRNPRYTDTLALALENDKLMTSGSDFHHISQAGSAGMIVPDEIDDQFALRDFLRSGKVCIFDSNGILYEKK